MTSKYSVNDDTGRRWDSDRRLVLTHWSSKPFEGHRHRHETVQQRLVVEYHHEVGVDLLHQARSTDTAKFPDSWTTVQALGVRQYGARYDRDDRLRWLE